jgi:hypothetical protein
MIDNNPTEHYVPLWDLTPSGPLTRWTTDEDFYRLKLEELFDLLKFPVKYENSKM